MYALPRHASRNLFFLPSDFDFSRDFLRPASSCAFDLHLRLSLRRESLLLPACCFCVRVSSSAAAATCKAICNLCVSIFCPFLFPSSSSTTRHLFLPRSIVIFAAQSSSFHFVRRILARISNRALLSTPLRSRDRLLLVIDATGGCLHTSGRTSAPTILDPPPAASGNSNKILPTLDIASSSFKTSPGSPSSFKNSLSEAIRLAIYSLS